VRVAAMNAFAQEHLFGIRVVQLLGRNTIAKREYDEINAGHRDAWLLQIRADAAMYALVEAISYIAVGLIIWYAAGHRAADAVTIATVIAFKEYVDRFFVPIRDLSAKYAVMQGAMAASERIFQLLDTHEWDGGEPSNATLVSRADRKPQASAPVIELADVHFTYGAEPVLRGVNVRVPRGATVALVGATGSGKSTVIKLLTRLYERTSGAIRIDGVDVRDIGLAELRRRITVVSQDVTLFAGTLAENITLGKPADRAQLEAAVRRVGLDRALGRRAGSNDLSRPEAEILIERGVHELMKGRTTLVIAHRLSTIRNADLIVVMDKGQIVEQGTHDELVAKGGLYAALEKTFRRKDD
jgi:ATP-binding cassette subfamily B multidrug efflux pump